MREEPDDTDGAVEPGRTITLTGTVTSLQTAHGIERVDIEEASRRRHRVGRRPARGHDRRHAHRSGRSAAAAAPRRRRADPADDVRREHLAAVRARGQVRDVAPDQGPPRPRGPGQRLRSRSSRPSRATRSRSAAGASSSWPSSSSRCGARASSSRSSRPEVILREERRPDPGAVRADHDRHPARVHRRGPARAGRPQGAPRADDAPTPTAASGWSSSCRSAASSATAASS